MRRLTYGCIAVLLGTAPLARAATQVQVVGLFPGAAVLLVEGQRKLVRVGQVGPGGVEVVSANSKGAVLRVDGVERPYAMTREVGMVNAESGAVRYSVLRGTAGHYWPQGSLNGTSFLFLFDTGATYVTLSEAHARRASLGYQAGERVQVSTASGLVNAWKVRLDRVSVGSLDVANVEALVLEGESPIDVLLGMSFLSRVEWREEGDSLLFRRRS
ncbi:retropepsin-like aspartic protease family protein [Phytopseudomonas dryadis]|uniref:TIGR02281 family clan AA aspartic protease n=1 Tax=Phytopseudomonas dryadis TaxID=2487520 RepID=A0A4Q9R757_9GAMM|nr:TIGR02281 family clan AA aspartic protease [Pseudomonas dryadis]TBU95901.1 TIGR02281 family clan AA aspartic protease [Pseudomonas dryadis]